MIDGRVAFEVRLADHDGIRSSARELGDFPDFLGLPTARVSKGEGSAHDRLFLKTHGT
jgi:hypothetical protein